MHFSGEEGMPVFRFVNGAVRRSIALICIGVLATASFAQNTQTATTQTPSAQATPTSTPEPVPPMPQTPAPQHNAHLYSDQNFAKGVSSFPKIWQPYVARNVAPSNITNSAMIDSVIHDGKIYLSLDAAIGLALENN